MKKAGVDTDRVNRKVSYSIDILVVSRYDPMNFARYPLPPHEKLFIDD